MHGHMRICMWRPLPNILYHPSSIMSSYKKRQKTLKRTHRERSQVSYGEQLLQWKYKTGPCMYLPHGPHLGPPFFLTCGLSSHSIIFQIHSRQHLGLLEKHKDYVLRAKDYARKKAELKALHEKVCHKRCGSLYRHSVVMFFRPATGILTSSITR